MEKEFDIIIIGGGPAGMSAGIYAARSGMRTLIIEKQGMGGQAALTAEIANYPGFTNIDGFTLSQNMYSQVVALGVEVLFCDVDNVNLTGKIKNVTCGGVTYSAPCIILSMGANSRGLGLSNEKQYLGKGLSYCAVCDGAFFRNKDVAVIGGGNSALEDAMYLAKVAKTVYLIHRREGFRAEQYVLDEFNNLAEAQGSNIIKKLNCVVEKLNGENKIESLSIRNVKTQTTENLEVDGVFVAIGRNPNTELLDGVVNTSKNGYIVVNSAMETNLEGVFAAGDITEKALRQVATAVSDGAIAGTNAGNYVKKNK